MLDIELSGLSSVLNLGAGGYTDFSNRPDFWKYIADYPIKVALDANPEHLKSWMDNSNSWLPLYLELFSGTPLPFIEDTFDVVIGTDFLEHFDIDDVDYIIEEAEIVASKYVIWFTPIGFLDTEKYQSEHVHTEWDIHRCGLESKFFKDRGYKVETIKNMHNFGNIHFDALWAWRSVS